MIDGVGFAEHLCVAAQAICADGTKVPVELWLGDTENKAVVTALLADLVDRSLSRRRGSAGGHRRGQVSSPRASRRCSTIRP
jgi:hypothetical protein